MLLSYSVLATSVLVISLSCVARSHSYLSNPHPYSRICTGCLACPKDPRPLSRLLHNNSPLETWQRGQKVNIRWTKNNHDGGFVRLSFLNLRDIYNISANKQFSFYHGCWEQGQIKCKGRHCGTDTEGVSFHRFITIPDNLPNGVYTLSFMWYGGITQNRKRGKFPVFMSCAHVRISGGVSLSDSFQPFFNTGNQGVLKNNGMCLTSATTPTECQHGCQKRQSFYDVPQAFKEGGAPAPIKSTQYDNFLNVDDNGHYGNKKYHDSEKRGSSSPSPMDPGNESVYKGNSSGNSNATRTGDNGDPQAKKHTCNHKARICCSATCGMCEQENCVKRDGGRPKCCPNYIRRRSGRKCVESSAPCYY